MSDNRVSQDSQFSFEAARPRPGLSVNTILLAEILALQFDAGATDQMKLSFVKSLLIKLTLALNGLSQNLASYKLLVKDLDEDLNSKLNSLFAPQPYSTLDPKEQLDRSSVEDRPPRHPARSVDLPYAHLDALSDYAGEAEIAPATSNVLSSYTSKSNSGTELAALRHLSVYLSKLPTLPLATYSHNRIQMPLPGIKPTSPIGIHDDDLSKDVNPFLDRISQTDQLFDPRVNQSQGELSTSKKDKQRKERSTSQKGSPYLGRKLENSTPKMYGMGIMGLDLPALVRRDLPVGLPGDISKTQERTVTSVANPRERYYQLVKGKGAYLTYTNLLNQAKSPNSNAMAVATADAKTQPLTPQLAGFDNADTDVLLFIQPKELGTILLRLITALCINKTNLLSFDPTIVLAAVDKKTQKEIWRFKKTHLQCAILDNELRTMDPRLPAFPEKGLFMNNLPAKVDVRRAGILDYFEAILKANLPRKGVHLVCRFLLTNTVNPLDDIEYNFSNEINEKDHKKQGFLIRRNKGLGANWRVRYCRCEGPDLLVYDELQGNLVDLIRLVGAQIGRQQESTAEDLSSNAKGYKHALLLKETKKNALGSSSNKHIFCAETDEERDLWINVLIEYVQHPEEYDNEPVELQNNLQVGTPGHLRSRSAEVSASAFFSADSSVLPVLTLPKQDSWEEEKDHSRRLRRRLFGGIRNKLLAAASPQDLDDFHMNAVTDLSGISGLSGMSGDTSMMTAATASTSILGPEEGSEVERVFGNTLEGAMRLLSAEVDGYKVPSIVYRCLSYLAQTGAGYQEGIFRLSGLATTIKQLRERFDAQHDVDLVSLDVRPEVNSVTGLLKLYLRELPLGLLPVDIENRLHLAIQEYAANTTAASPQLARVKIEGSQNGSVYLTYVYQFKSLVNQIPMASKAVIYCLLKFLNGEVLARSDYNKMNLRNLVIVFSATLNVEPKILCELFINFEFFFGNGAVVNEDQRPSIEMGSIPLV